MAFIEQYTSQVSSLFGGSGAAGFFGALGGTSDASSPLDASTFSFGAAIEAVSAADSFAPINPAVLTTPLNTSQYSAEITLETETIASADAITIFRDQLSSLSLDDFSDLFLSGQNSQLDDISNPSVDLDTALEADSDIDPSSLVSTQSTLVNEPLINVTDGNITLNDIVAGLFGTATGIDISEARPIDLNFETITLAPSPETISAIASSTSLDQTPELSTPILATPANTATPSADPLEALALSSGIAETNIGNTQSLADTEADTDTSTIRSVVTQTTITPSAIATESTIPTNGVQTNAPIVAGTSEPSILTQDINQTSLNPETIIVSDTTNTDVNALASGDSNEVNELEIQVQRDLLNERATIQTLSETNAPTALDTAEVAAAANAANNANNRPGAEISGDGSQRTATTNTSVEGQLSVNQSAQANGNNGQNFNGGTNSNRDFIAEQGTARPDATSSNATTDKAQSFSDTLNTAQNTRADATAQAAQPVQSSSTPPAPLPTTPPLTPEALLATSFGGTTFASSFGNLLGEGTGLFSEPNVFGGRPSEALVGQVRNQFNIAISRAVVNGDQEINVRLNPVELGRVNVQLQFAEEGRIRANIAVENPETLELLQRDAKGLERALEASGHKTENGGISFSLENGDQESAGKALAEALQQEQLRDELAARSGDTLSNGNEALAENNNGAEEIPLEDILPYVSTETGVDIRI